MNKRNAYETSTFSLVIIRNFDGRWLCVKECGDQGWWIAGGFVEHGEDLYTAAIRETEEEAGIKIKILGVLRVEHSSKANGARLRIIFFAEPYDDKQIPKKIPDGESQCAEWFTLDEIVNLQNSAPGWRGSELYEWPLYIENGGIISPMNFLTKESRNTEKFEYPQFKFTYPNNNINYNVKKVQNITQDISKEEFIKAVFAVDLPVIKKALINGFNPNLEINEKKWNPLHFAIKSQNLEFINILLIYNANIDSLTHRNRNTFHFAVQENAKIINIFILKMTELDNTTINTILNRQDKDDGETPLFRIARTISNGDNSLIKSYETLIGLGADTNIKNYSGVSCNDILNKNIK